MNTLRHASISTAPRRPLVDGVLMKHPEPVGIVDRHYVDLHVKRWSEVQNQRYGQLLVADDVVCRLEEAVQRPWSWMPSETIYLFVSCSYFIRGSPVHQAN